jgi:lysophospholipase L1-like esterase
VTRRGAALGVLATAVALATPASASAELSLSASARSTGYVELRLHADPGFEVAVQEQGEAERRLTPTAPDTRLRRFATWRCDRRKRIFAARQTGSDGIAREATAVVRTPSCTHRLVLSAPRHVLAGRRARVLLRDRWRLGDLVATVCTRAPGERRRCRDRRPGAFAYAALRPGAHALTLRTRWQRLRRTIHAANPGGRLTVLATGDSMIQIIDSYLKQRIGSRRVHVRSDARIATGISKPSLLDWQAHARRQAAEVRPDATVMFIGANDGFPMAGADCCGGPWIAEYARRAGRMMRSYARGGRGRVYWLLLPAPRGGLFRETFPAVNAALRRAARGRADDVRLIDLARVFTPGGRYRATMRIRGKLVRVRQGDGVHLNTTGASLAASIVIRALRRDRVLP